MGLRALLVLLVAASPLGLACVFTLADPRTLSRPEAGLDSSSSTADASTDVDANAVTADGSSFCDAVDAAFCEDFDRGGLEGSRWPIAPTQNRGTVRVIGDASTSPPSCLSARTEPLATSAGNTAYVSQRLDGNAQRVHIDLDLFVDRSEATGFAHVHQITFGPPGAPDYVSFVVHPDGRLEIFERVSGATVSKSSDAAVLPLASWVHLTVELERSGSPDAGALTIDVDGGRALERLPVSTLGQSNETHAHVGLVRAQGPTGVWSVLVDNLVIAYE